MSIAKPIDEITEHDLQTLIEEKEAESKIIDYKKMLNLEVEKAKEDFRKDVISFANASGGDIVIGMDEGSGIPIQLCGFDMGSMSQEQYRLRLVEVLQSRIKPRIQGIAIRPIQLSNDKWATIVRVPRSFAKPHQIEIGNKDFQFWIRLDTGNQRMDIDEIRDSIIASDTLAERIRSFRAERIGAIISGETPIIMKSSPKLVLHIIPLGSFSTTANYDLSQMEVGNLIRLAPICDRLQYFRHNFDGFITYTAPPESTSPNSYLQVYRNGILEAVEGMDLYIAVNLKIVPATILEKQILASIPRLFDIQKELGVEPPCFVMVSMLRVRGFNIVRRQFSHIVIPTPIDRDILNVPEVLVENFQVMPAALMRPTFDTIWNAAGYSACPNYDPDGNWMNVNND